ncbi:MAG: Ig-like domain-containing protein, partial [Okeania sp. SIO4D6]|nr:Ig-like domain-containing protein [Okeania sp. SIO4D6]
MTVLNETFDNDLLFTKSTPFFSDSAQDYFGISDGTNSGDYDGNSAPSGIKSYTGFSGNFLTGMDLDGEGASLPVSLTWSGVNIDGLTNLEFSGDFAEFFDSPGSVDNSDYILVEYQIDSGGFQPLLEFRLDENEDDGTNGVFKEDTDFNGSGDGTTLGDAAQTFTKAIAGTGSTLDLRLTVSLNAANEDFGIDNFIVSDSSGSDTTAPKIETFTPADNDSSVAVDVNLVMDFDENLQAGSGNKIGRACIC